MEPATLYMLLKVGDAPERQHTGHFGSKELCELHLARVIERKPPDIQILKSVCWEHGTYAPEWIVENKVIHGVPLDSRYMPPTNFP